MSAKGDLQYNGFFAVLLGVIAVVSFLAGIQVGGILLLGTLWFGVKAAIAWNEMNKQK